MKRHPLDPIALVLGAATVLGGIVALLHQAGAFRLGLGPVALTTCIVVGFGGAVLVLLLRRTPPPSGLDGPASDSVLADSVHDDSTADAANDLTDDRELI